MCINDLIKTRKTIIQGTVCSLYSNYITNTYICLTISEIQPPSIVKEVLFSVRFPPAGR